MKPYYEKVLLELVDIVEKSCDALQKNHELFEDSIGELIFLRDKQFGAYKSIVEANEYRAAKAIESIAVELFTKQKRDDFTFYSEAIQNKEYPAHLQNKARPFEIVLKENKKRVGLVFGNFDDVRKAAKDFMSGKYNVDKIKMIILVEPDSFSYKTFFSDVNTMHEHCDIQIERIPILEFWSIYFGEEECEELVQFIEMFNEKAKQIIGFNTVITPSEKALAKFREKCSSALLKPVDLLNIPDAFHEQYKTLINNYENRKLWKAMIGDSNFAISFITSEWFYNMYQLTENLDLTNIVAGYLKSIEQLLLAIILLSTDRKITIRSKDKKIIKLTKENEEIIDTTLGALENAIRYNGDILEINHYAKNCLVDIIKDWREKQRNGYFHKDNLHSLKKVEEIRNRALQLYFLILGSCIIKDEQFNQLGINLQ